MTTDRPDGGGETAEASLRRSLIRTGTWRAPGPGGPRWQGHLGSSPGPPCPPSPAANAVSTASESYRARLNHRPTDPTQNWPICASPAIRPPDRPRVQTRRYTGDVCQGRVRSRWCRVVGVRLRRAGTGSVPGRCGGLRCRRRCGRRKRRSEAGSWVWSLSIHSTRKLSSSVSSAASLAASRISGMVIGPGLLPGCRPGRSC
jgi:hypothetical protein